MFRPTPNRCAQAIDSKQKVRQRINGATGRQHLPGAENKRIPRSVRTSRRRLARGPCARVCASPTHRSTGSPASPESAAGRTNAVGGGRDVADRRGRRAASRRPLPIAEIDRHAGVTCFHQPGTVEPDAVVRALAAWARPTRLAVFRLRFHADRVVGFLLRNCCGCEPCAASTKQRCPPGRTTT